MPCHALPALCACKRGCGFCMGMHGQAVHIAHQRGGAGATSGQAGMLPLSVCLTSARCSSRCWGITCYCPSATVLQPPLSNRGAGLPGINRAGPQSAYKYACSRQQLREAEGRSPTAPLVSRPVAWPCCPAPKPRPPPSRLAAAGRQRSASAQDDVHARVADHRPAQRAHRQRQHRVLKRLLHLPRPAPQARHSSAQHNAGSVSQV